MVRELGWRPKLSFPLELPLGRVAVEEELGRFHQQREALESALCPVHIRARAYKTALVWLKLSRYLVGQTIHMAALEEMAAFALRPHGARHLGF